jgi:uncharacterized membrane protein YbaN (DUF454 family)
VASGNGSGSLVSFPGKVVAHLCRLAVGIGAGYFAIMGDTVETQMGTGARRKARSPIVRGLLFVLGLICLVLVPISIYVPLIPTFDLVLLAAFFFSMSSDRMYDWMLNHRYLGKVIRGYRDHGLTMRMKWVAAVAITASLTASGIFLTDLWWVRAILAAVGAYALWFVFSRPTRDPATV